MEQENKDLFIRLINIIKNEMEIIANDDKKYGYDYINRLSKEVLIIEDFIELIIKNKDTIDRHYRIIIKSCIKEKLDFYYNEMFSEKFTRKYREECVLKYEEWFSLYLYVDKLMYIVPV